MTRFIGHEPCDCCGSPYRNDCVIGHMCGCHPFERCAVCHKCHHHCKCEGGYKTAEQHTIETLAAELQKAVAAYTWTRADKVKPALRGGLMLVKCKNHMVATGWWSGDYWWVYDQRKGEHHPAYESNPVEYWCDLPKGGEQ